MSEQQVDPAVQVIVPNSGGQVVVGQTLRTVYSDPGDTALVAVLEPFLRRVEWVPLRSTSNMSGATLEVQVQTVTGLSVASGTDASNNLNIAASFKDLTVNFGGTTKTFTSREATNCVPTTLSHTVSPGQKLYLYQRRYTFRQRIWWMWDAWGKYWTVGQDGNKETVQATILLNIDSEEVIERDSPLAGQQAVYVQPISRPRTEDQYEVVQFGNLRSNAKDSINGTLNSAARNV